MIQVKTVEEFQKEVIEVQVLVIVDFWANWCPPCKMLAPVLEELANEYENRVRIVKVDVDEARDLARHYDVMSIPTVLFFKEGKIVDTSIGAVPKAVLVEKLKPYLES
ncbi:thioredoxin [candidate division WOR-3 bacterium]|nr:thioredoxin [candidate division WOR-3 bacterium]